MKYFKNLFLILLSITIYSCSDKNNPIAPIFENNYFGGIGTERTYKETEKWLKVGSNLPFFNVPDTLLSRVYLTKDQLQSGVVFISNYTESVEPIDNDFYTSWKLTLPQDNYLETESKGKSYSLSNELDSLLHNKTYSMENYRIGQDIFLLTNDAVMTINPSNLQANFPSVPFIKNKLQISDSWIRYEFIDTTTHKAIFETVAKVINIENINIIAGNFNAYKIKLTTYHYNPDYSFEEGYEYYVPYVGLVLKESNMIVNQWSSDTNLTINFRQIIYKELVSYNFVK